MDEEEEEMECNINNITCDTPFQSPLTANVQKRGANWSLERQLDAGILAESRISNDKLASFFCTLLVTED